jgi:hypothetical protein
MTRPLTADEVRVTSMSVDRPLGWSYRSTEGAFISVDPPIKGYNKIGEVVASPLTGAILADGHRVALLGPNAEMTYFDSLGKVLERKRVIQVPRWARSMGRGAPPVMADTQPWEQAQADASASVPAEEVICAVVVPVLDPYQKEFMQADYELRTLADKELLFLDAGTAQIVSRQLFPAADGWQPVHNVDYFGKHTMKWSADGQYLFVVLGKKGSRQSCVVVFDRAGREVTRCQPGERLVASWLGNGVVQVLTYSAPNKPCPDGPKEQLIVTGTNS